MIPRRRLSGKRTDELEEEILILVRVGRCRRSLHSPLLQEDNSVAHYLNLVMRKRKILHGELSV